MRTITIVLADDFDSIIEYYIHNATYANSHGTILELSHEQDKLIKAIANARGCTYEIVAVSLLEWGRLHPGGNEFVNIKKDELFG